MTSEYLNVYRVVGHIVLLSVPERISHGNAMPRTAILSTGITKSDSRHKTLNLGCFL